MDRRRSLILFGSLGAFAVSLRMRRGCAVTINDGVAAFVAAAGSRLSAASALGPQQDRRTLVGQIVTDVVDVNAVAEFCLGRFWRVASLSQQSQFVDAFRTMLVDAVCVWLTGYQRMRFTLHGTRPELGNVIASTTIEAPVRPPVTVDWVIAGPAQNPRIIDAITGDTSLRLKQRADYAAYLSHNPGDLDALIKGLRQTAEGR
jgi:phospholipid transport system substrate-binding protein